MSEESRWSLFTSSFKKYFLSNLINKGPDSLFKKLGSVLSKSSSHETSQPLPSTFSFSSLSLVFISVLFFFPLYIHSVMLVVHFWHWTVYHLLHQRCHHNHNHQHHRFSFPSYRSCTNEGWFLKSILAQQLIPSQWF